jgi:solute:Na+ symporter, SSS family
MAATMVAWPDVLLALLLMALSVGASVWKGQKGGGSHSSSSPNNDDSSPGALATALSLLVSTFSGISLLAAPAESFAHGIFLASGILVFLWIIPLIVSMFLPWLLRSNVKSVYELVERKYSSSPAVSVHRKGALNNDGVVDIDGVGVGAGDENDGDGDDGLVFVPTAAAARLRFLASLLSVGSQLLYVAVAVFAPSQALSSITPLSTGVWIAVTAAVSLLVALLGGIRGLIWTDALLATVLGVCLVGIIARGLGAVPGGFAEVVRLADEGGHLTVFDWRFGSRTSTWGVVLGSTINSAAAFITNQGSTQHFVEMGNLEAATRVVWLQLPFTLVSVGALYFIGLIIYAFYQSQSQLLLPASESASGSASASGSVDVAVTPDQIFAFFVVSELPGWGTPGLFLMALIACTVSTVGSAMNGLSTCVVQDLLPASVRISHNQGVVALTVLSTLLSFLMGSMPSIIYAANVVLGLAAGPLLGLFVICLLDNVKSTAHGMTYAVLLGLTSGLLFVAGQLLAPTSTMGSVSFMWVPVIAFVVTVSSGAGMSWSRAPEPESIRHAVVGR